MKRCYANSEKKNTFLYLNPTDTSKGSTAAQLVFYFSFPSQQVHFLCEYLPLCFLCKSGAHSVLLDSSIFIQTSVRGDKEQEQECFLCQVPANFNQLAERLLLHSSVVTASDISVKLHTHTHAHSYALKRACPHMHRHKKEKHFLSLGCQVKSCHIFRACQVNLLVYVKARQFHQ